MTSPILSNSLISWVRVRAKSRFWLANRQHILLSKQHLHKDCFNSVNSEGINYVFNVLTLMPAGTLTMAVQRHTALFIFSSQGVMQWGEESLFLFPASPSPSVFSARGGGGEKRKVPPPSPGNFTASALSLCPPCSIPMEKSGDNAKLSGRGGGGETGSL